jgi:hypothetical protein
LPTSSPTSATIPRTSAPNASDPPEDDHDDHQRWSRRRTLGGR